VRARRVRARRGREGWGGGEAVFGREEFGGEALEDLRLLLPDGDREGALADREGIDALAGRDDAAPVLLFLLGETLDEPLAVEDEGLRLFAELVVDLEGLEIDLEHAAREVGPGLGLRGGGVRRGRWVGAEVEAPGADLFLAPLDGGEDLGVADAGRERADVAAGGLERVEERIGGGEVAGLGRRLRVGFGFGLGGCVRGRRGRVGCRRRLIAGGARGRVALRG